MSLLAHHWLPVERLGGGTALIRPADIAVTPGLAPVADLAWPRADFRIAGREFLIGLLATCCPPEDDDDWAEWWHHPPSPDDLQARLAPFAEVFRLDGNSARFCQDYEDFPGEVLPIERLLIDAPGENTVKRNTDLIVKRNRAPVLGGSAAAMALYTLQAFAPSGGAGHRTSLRGGGPLVTMVLPPKDDAHEYTLWHALWANVPNGTAPKPDQCKLVFPWLAPTRTSDLASNGRPTALGSDHAHPLQALWGMPRRIRLELRAALPGEVCALTGRPDAVMVTGFRTRPWGVQYVNSVQYHPLTPTYRSKPAEPPLAVHPQPDGIGYRHWVGLVEPEGKTTQPAGAVVTFSKRLRHEPGDGLIEARLLIAGYDMDNMKARGFVEAEMPLFVTATDQDRQALHALAAQLAVGATEIARLLRNHLRDALQVADADRTAIDAVRARFYEQSSTDFWTILRGAATTPDASYQDQTLKQHWLAALRRIALTLFDAAAPLDPLDPRAVCGPDGQPPPIVVARKWLCLSLSGYGKGGAALFQTLGLPAAAQAKAVRAKKKANTHAG